MPVIIPNIKGDLTGEGVFSARDLSMMKKAIAGTVVLTEAESYRADMNDDGKLTAKDISLLKKLIAG